MILKLEGYEVQIAYNGETALQVARTFRPEAILSDIGLPGIDGHELARRIRQDPDLSASVGFLAAVTGHAEAESLRRSREAGFDQHRPVGLDLRLSQGCWPRPNGVQEARHPESRVRSRR